MVQVNTKKFIDIREIIRRKNPNLLKFIPGFIINYIKRIIHEDDLNNVIVKYKEYEGLEFLENSLSELNIQFEIDGEENLPPPEKRCIFAANHPIGSVDGLVFMREMGKYYGITKSLVNDLLLHVKNFQPLFAGVNKHGANSKDHVEELDKIFASDYQILLFPAGLVSRRKHGEIEDPEWKKTVISRAVKHERDIVPIYIDGRLSDFFYNLARIRSFLGIKINLEMFYLVDEMFRQKNKRIRFIVGKPIHYKIFNKSHSDKEWADRLKKHVYKLRSDRFANFE
jgi:putative hemolysin